MSEHVTITEAAGIVEIRLNRPEKRNALNGAMYEACLDALVGGCARASVRAFLFTSEGPTFCAGNDIADFLRLGGEVQQTPATRFIRALPTCTKPMVAAVQGEAVGIGTTMLLHCDLVYASPEASLSVPFVGMGLVPEAGSSLLLPQRLGAQRAARMLLLGEPMGAGQALQAGLLNEIVPHDALRGHASAKAAILAAKPPMALAAARALMRAGQDALLARMDQEMEAFARAVRGPEAREAFTAFLEKRPADFSGAPDPG